MTEKTLEQLADEYDAAIIGIDEQIAHHRELLLAEKRKHKSVKLISLGRTLALLYDQRSELRETRDYLRTYYEKQVRCAG